MMTAVRLERGEVVRLKTGTGGGFGDPALRPRDQVLRDIKNGYFTRAQAERWFGLDDE
jgi:N-methylhydantoinase B